jgi:hypothetical protein
MKQVLVECYPDGLLVSKLGFKKREIFHYFGKSRVYSRLSKSSGCIAMVDEDPGVSIYPYENKLIFREEKSGIKQYSDSNKNKILILKIKLEDWIISACHSQKIDPNRFGLPTDPKHLHDKINQKLDKFDDLIEELKKQKNPAILQLKSWLK